MHETIWLRQSSMQHSDPIAAIVADLADAIPVVGKTGYGPDVIGLTELGGRIMRAKVRARARQTGYVLHRLGSVGVLVHPRHEILEVGGVHVLDGLKAKPGGHQPRDIAEVTFLTPAGNVVTVHEAHWITDAPGNDKREAKRRLQSEVMVERVRMHGRGRRLSFWMGDTNEDEGRREQEVQRPLTVGGLESIYDELHEYPTTHGRSKTIDVMGSYRPDGRVTAERVEVGPRGNTPKRRSDHRRVDGWFRIAMGRTR